MSSETDRTKDEPTWRCFWYDGTEDVSPEHAEPATLPQIVARMRELLTRRDKTFVGVVDEKGVCLQFAGQPDGTVLMEIPIPSLSGSWYVHLDLDDCCRRVAALDAAGRIEVTNYPDMRHRLWFSGEPTPMA